MKQELRDCLQEIQTTMQTMRDYAVNLGTEDKLPTTREYTDLLVAKAKIVYALSKYEKVSE